MLLCVVSSCLHATCLSVRVVSCPRVLSLHSASCVSCLCLRAASRVVSSRRGFVLVSGPRVVCRARCFCYVFASSSLCLRVVSLSRVVVLCPIPVSSCRVLYFRVVSSCVVRVSCPLFSCRFLVPIGMSLRRVASSFLHPG